MTSPRQGPPCLSHHFLVSLPWPLPTALEVTAISYCPSPRRAALLPTLSPAFLNLFPFRPPPTSSLSHLSDPPAEDVEGNYAFCGFSFEVSIPTFHLGASAGHTHPYTWQSPQVPPASTTVAPGSRRS